MDRDALKQFWPASTGHSRISRSRWRRTSSSKTAAHTAGAARGRSPVRVG
jgi:hypothetical protein